MEHDNYVLLTIYPIHCLLEKTLAGRAAWHQQIIFLIITITIYIGKQHTDKREMNKMRLNVFLTAFDAVGVFFTPWASYWLDTYDTLKFCSWLWGVWRGKNPLMWFCNIWLRNWYILGHCNISLHWSKFYWWNQLTGMSVFWLIQGITYLTQ